MKSPNLADAQGKPLSEEIIKAAIHVLDLLYARHVMEFVETLNLDADPKGHEGIIHCVQGMIKSPKVDISTVANLIANYHLVRDVDTHEIAVAMLLMDIVPMKLADIAAEDTEFQENLLKMLDTLCAQRGPDEHILSDRMVDELTEPIRSIVRASKKRGKIQMWSLLGSRLIRQFGLDPHQHTNIYHVRDEATYRYYLRTRKERLEQLQSDSGRHPDRAPHNLDELLWVLASEWEHIREDIEKMGIQPPTADQAKPLAAWLKEWHAVPSPYARLPLDMPVKFISDPSEVAAAETAILSADVVGLSYQHRTASAYTLDQDARVSLVAVATGKQIFVFDVDAMSESDAFVAFLCGLLRAQKPRKISFQIETARKNLELLRADVSAALDNMPEKGLLEKLYKKPLPKLDALVLEVTKLKVDTNEDLSDWRRRPLRPAQLHHIALSAMLQLNLYYALRARETSSTATTPTRTPQRRGNAAAAAADGGKTASPANANAAAAAAGGSTSKTATPQRKNNAAAATATTPAKAGGAGGSAASTPSGKSSKTPAKASKPATPAKAADGAAGASSAAAANGSVTNGSGALAGK